MGESVNPFVRDVLRGMEIDTTIHPRDEMLLHALKDHRRDFAVTSYFQLGREAAAMYLQFLDAFFDGRRDIRLLDFAAGFGRVTRFFAALHGAQQVSAADIQRDAVEFQRVQFGIDAFVSSSDPAEFKPERRFDCIVALSFFSHVPLSRFTEWIVALTAALEQDGILVFSVHDGETRFEPTSETDRLDGSEYGTTWVSETYVRDAVTRACPGRSVIRIPRGLANFQDLYVVYSGAMRVVEFDQGPFGYASIARLFGDEFHLVGWASHWNAMRSVRSVAVELNGEAVARTTSFFPRRDVVEHLGDERHLNSGWHLTFKIPPRCSQMTDVLTVKAVSDRGMEMFLYAGTIAGLLESDSNIIGRHDFLRDLEKLKAGAR